MVAGSRSKVAGDALIPNSFGTVSRRAGAETNALSEEAEYRAALSRQGRDVSMVAGSRSKVAKKPGPQEADAQEAGNQEADPQGETQEADTRKLPVEVRQEAEPDFGDLDRFLLQAAR